MKGRADSPSVPRVLGDHEDRIRILEFADTQGWRFDVDNEGGWGYLQFNDCLDLDTLPDPLTVGGTWGAAFEDDSGCGFLIGSTSLLLLKTRAAPLTLLADGGGDINATANDGEVFLLSQVSGATYPQVFMDADASSNSLFLGANDSFAKLAYLTLDSSVPEMRVHVTDGAGGGDVVCTVGHDFDVEVGNASHFKLPTGGTFNVTNHLGAVILRVDESGGYHIKTGATWVADL